MRAGRSLANDRQTWPNAASAIDSHVLEVMTARIDPSRTAESLETIWKGKQAIAIGPGLGLGEDARMVVEYALAAWHGPIVVRRRRGWTAFAGKPEVFRAAKNAVLTPHPGELARLLGKTPAQVESDRFGAARAIVSATGAVVVLKGAHTVIAAPDARIAVSPSRAPLGDRRVGGRPLGIVAAMACTLPPFEAACAAVLLHGLAGETWSREHGGADRGMLASEIADALTAVRT